MLDLSALEHLEALSLNPAHFDEGYADSGGELLGYLWRLSSRGSCSRDSQRLVLEYPVARKRWWSDGLYDANGLHRRYHVQVDEVEAIGNGRLVPENEHVVVCYLEHSYIVRAGRHLREMLSEERFSRFSAPEGRAGAWGHLWARMDARATIVRLGTSTGSVAIQDQFRWGLAPVCCQDGGQVGSLAMLTWVSLLFDGDRPESLSSLANYGDVTNEQVPTRPPVDLGPPNHAFSCNGGVIFGSPNWF